MPHWCSDYHSQWAGKKGNGRTPDKSYRSTLILYKEGICIALKPDEMGRRCFWGLYALEETLDFKGEKR